MGYCLLTLKMTTQQDTQSSKYKFDIEEMFDGMDYYFETLLCIYYVLYEL